MAPRLILLSVCVHRGSTEYDSYSIAPTPQGWVSPFSKGMSFTTGMPERDEISLLTEATQEKGENRGDSNKPFTKSAAPDQGATRKDMKILYGDEVQRPTIT